MGILSNGRTYLVSRKGKFPPGVMFEDLDGGKKRITCFDPPVEWTFEPWDRVTKVCGVDWQNTNGALTLNASEVREDPHPSGTHFSRTHPDGWTIKGEVHEDYYEWVNYFEAEHPVWGRVWGDFEEEVHADSEEGFQAFRAAHEPEQWDYADI